jgi:hypothetical protein
VSALSGPPNPLWVSVAREEEGTRPDGRIRGRPRGSRSSPQAPRLGTHAHRRLSGSGLSPARGISSTTHTTPTPDPTQCDAGIRNTVVCVDDDAIRSLLTRLARAHPDGGTVIERAAVMAAGADSEAIMTWILAHGGNPRPRSRPRPDTACTDRAFTPVAGPSLGFRLASCYPPARSTDPAPHVRDRRPATCGLRGALPNPALQRAGRAPGRVEQAATRFPRWRSGAACS